MTNIEWTDETWNPITGCTPISDGCTNCYAKKMSKRLKAMGQPKYRKGFKIATHFDALWKPYEWKKPRKVFVCSMSDIYHQDVMLEFHRQMFEVMNATPHTYQLLTKRSANLFSYDLLGLLPWTKNIWQGVSIESSKYLFRADHLRKTGAHIKFLSIEPLLSSIPNLDLSGINWVIVGGESGPNARHMKADWVRDIRDQCTKQKVPFFFKQWGGKNKKATGRLLDGRTYDEFPSTRTE